MAAESSPKLNTENIENAPNISSLELRAGARRGCWSICPVNCYAAGPIYAVAFPDEPRQRPGRRDRSADARATRDAAREPQRQNADRALHRDGREHGQRRRRCLLATTRDELEHRGEDKSHENFADGCFGGVEKFVHAIRTHHAVAVTRRRAR